MNPNIWGPHAWIFLHYVTLGYPECPDQECRDNYKKFFTSLKDILPCDTCKEHCRENMKRVPLTDEIMNSREKLFKWLVDLHNEVNSMNGKKKITYDKAIEMYDSDTKQNNNKELIIALVVIIVILLLFIIISFIVLRNRDII